MSAQEQSAEHQPSLYRRRRPRTFDDMVGQEAVVRTLRNAVERDRVHHAYLFVGSRGTGKTSMAKILAACLNCERGPTTEPCGKCESCLSIAAATSLDVIEMDAASNNSVEDIRELRDSVAYAPVSGRRKVYILDEAHMLSTAAWNAFLKTLEEPPPNTVFVLATTEANKVPATVVDRCHRFDFHRPSVEQIAYVIRRAAEAESIEIPPAAVAALARSATGSFRDALGTLEQLVTYSGKRVAVDDALAVLGVTDASLLEASLDAVAAGDSARALRAVEECVAQGRDPGSFAADLEMRARELLVVQTLSEVPPELSLTPEADAALAEQAGRLGHAVVVRVLELLGEAMEAVRAGADPRTRLELALVKAARPELDGSTAALSARIERLERAASSPASSSAEPERSEEAPRPARGTRGESSSSQISAQAAPEQPAAETPLAQGPAEVSSAHERPEAAVAQAGDETPPPSEAATQAGPQADGEIASLRAAWPAVVELVRGQNALLGALIEEAEPVAVSRGELTVAFAARAPFLKKKAEDPTNRAAVAAALAEVTGRRWQLTYELHALASGEASGERRSSSEEEWVRRLMEEFDAEELQGGEARAQVASGVPAAAESDRGRVDGAREGS